MLDPPSGARSDVDEFPDGALQAIHRRLDPDVQRRDDACCASKVGEKRRGRGSCLHARYPRGVGDGGGRGIREDAIDDKQLGIRRRGVTQMLQYADDICVGPVVEDVAQEKDRSVLDRLSAKHDRSEGLRETQKTTSVCPAAQIVHDLGSRT